ncbi:hypothetical protein CYFUS_008979 [Cystobacter fuscus]|uniref:Uncharacterized protein n=1 Tax=Cystobacter fuscus TaxID=43 RepID=A0A250JHX7_9BACT|nr:hypothetical protein [Cystobacter fuscus]ATB43499.1 hypothetical protein CYFUS_008979 [Cystobacter fuscus]
MPASEERRLQALVLAPVRRVQRRLHTARFAEAGVVPVWAAATACVLGRLLLRDAFVWALPVPLLASGVWWFLRARARRVSLAHAAVLADRSAGAGGLLLTRLERPVGEWELAANQYARAVTPPAVAWRRPVGALLAALVFLAVGLLLPLPARAVRPANAAAAAKVDAVRAKAEALAHEESPGSAVDEELRRLAEEVAEGRFDAADWEAADRLEQSLDAQAARAASELASASEAARELESALDAASGAEAATREREALESALMKVGSPGEGEPGEAPRTGEVGSAGSQGQETPRSRAEVADLRATLERRQRELERRFGQGEGRKGARSDREQGEGEGEGEGEGSSRGHASRGAGKGKGVGKGGGEETQPLVFGEKAEMDPERLAFKPLPKGQGGEAAGLWGLKAVEPERREAGPGGGARGEGARGDAEAGHSTGPLLPRNRELVKRYFGEQP